MAFGLHHYLSDEDCPGVVNKAERDQGHQAGLAGWTKGDGLAPCTIWPSVCPAALYISLLGTLRGLKGGDRPETTQKAWS
jgi:hypothetical protein